MSVKKFIFEENMVVGEKTLIYIYCMTSNTTPGFYLFLEVKRGGSIRGGFNREVV